MTPDAIHHTLSTETGRHFVADLLFEVLAFTGNYNGERAHHAAANAAIGTAANKVFTELMSEQPELTLEMVREHYARGNAP